MSGETESAHKLLKEMHKELQKPPKHYEVIYLDASVSDADPENIRWKKVDEPKGGGEPYYISENDPVDYYMLLSLITEHGGGRRRIGFKGYIYWLMKGAIGRRKDEEMHE
jgi:hypothetical protein